MTWRCLSFLAAAFAMGEVRAADVISVNLTEFNSDVQNIVSGQSYGVASLGSAVTGWVNLNQTLSRANLPFSSGSLSTVSFQGTAPNSWGSAAAGYNNTPMKGMVDDYTATLNPTQMSFSNLNANFPGGYFAIVYLTGFNANDGASITDGTTTYYYQPVDFTAGSWDGTLVQTTTTSDLGSGNAPVAQYAVFGSEQAPLTADSVTFTLNALYGGGAGIGGAQLVSAVPEPAALALIGVTAPMVCGVVARRYSRRRRDG